MNNYWIYIIFFLLHDLSYSQISRAKLDSTAEDFHAISLQNNQSSIYINTSKGIYETNEDLWFKATLLNDQTLLPYVGDQTLYVQLRNLQNDSIVLQSKYKIEDGFCAGRIFLHNNITPGEYFLEAFSKSSFNKQVGDYHGNRKILVVENISGFKGFPGETENHPNLADFQLLPEGGQLVDGLTSKIAFKAVDSIGNPVEVSGVILENERPILSFQTTHAGMGSFILTPKYKSSYSVKLDDITENLQFKIVFPTVKRNGTTFQIINNNDHLGLRVKSNIGPQQIYIRVQSRGIIQSMVTANFIDSLTFQIPTTAFPQGVHELTLLDEDLRPVAGRLVYINRKEKLNINTKLSKEVFGKKEKVNLKIKVTDSNGNPVQSHLSLSVFDHKFIHPFDGKNILTHYYLSEALKGKICNPDHYFKDESRAEDLDLLLLTQGWRKYKWHEDHLNSKKDPLLKDGISGRIVYRNLETLKDQKTIIIFDPITEQGYVQPLDSLGNFYINASYLDMGRQFYIKHFDADKKYKPVVNIDDEFQKIKIEDYVINYPIFPYTNSSESLTKSELNSYSEQLQEVQLTGKGSNQYSNKYIGKLDSLANIRITNDYIGIPCGTFNCPLHPDDQSKKPIAGEEYEEIIGFEWVNEKKRSYKVRGHRRFVYEKIPYTEEELLRKFNLSSVSGYVPKIEFYSPNYKLEDSNIVDYRNTLIWDPLISTDKNGEYEISFYTSDFVSKFLVVVEGVSNTGQLGRFDSQFLVF